MPINFSRYDDFCRLRQTVEEKVGWVLPEKVRVQIVEKLLQHMNDTDPIVSLKAIGLLLQVEKSNQAAVKVEANLLLQNRVMAPGEEWEEIRANNAIGYAESEPEPQVEDTPADIEVIRRAALNQKRMYGSWPPDHHGYITDLIAAEMT
jgi:hypothetical protein